MKGNNSISKLMLKIAEEERNKTLVENVNQEFRKLYRSSDFRCNSQKFPKVNKLVNKISDTNFRNIFNKIIEKNILIDMVKLKRIESNFICVDFNSLVQEINDIIPSEMQRNIETFNRLKFNHIVRKQYNKASLQEISVNKINLLKQISLLKQINFVRNLSMGKLLKLRGGLLGIDLRTIGFAKCAGISKEKVKFTVCSAQKIMTFFISIILIYLLFIYRHKIFNLLSNSSQRSILYKKTFSIIKDKKEAILKKGKNILKWINSLYKVTPPPIEINRSDLKNKMLEEEKKMLMQEKIMNELEAIRDRNRFL